MVAHGIVIHVVAQLLGGHLEILKWARENGCAWGTTVTCSNLAYSEDHLEILKWARENGCPWDSDTCKNAAYKGHLEVLKWARVKMVANGIRKQKNLL